MTGDAVPRYRFPAVDGAVWRGFRPLPIATAAAAITVAVASLYAGAPLPVGALLLAVGLLAATMPAAGRSAVEWLPVLARAGAAALTRRDRRAAPPLLPAACPTRALRLPADLGGQRLLEAAGAAVLDDPAARQRVGVLAVAGSDRFALLDPDGQARLLDAWGTALATVAADDRIRRVQWLERAAPEDRDTAAWLRERAVDPGAADDYQRLVDTVASTATRHQLWVAVAFARDLDTAAVPAALADVAAALAGAELAARPLPVAELTELLRSEVDGSWPQVGAAQHVGALSRHSRWDAVRTDDTWHRSFAVTGWPRLPMTSGWLEPLLLAAPPGAARTVAVHLQPVAPAVAARQARAARSRSVLDAADRGRLGFVENAGADAAAGEAADTEAELVAGYRMHRVAAAITVSAADLRALDDACRTLRTAAQAARLELRPLHGQHLGGLVATMPLCRPGRAGR